MSQPISTPVQPPPVQPPDAPRKSRRWPWIVAIVVALFTGVGIGSAGNSDTTSTTPAASAATTSPASTAASTPAVVEDTPTVAQYAEPTNADFTLKVKTLTKECFGSAGCNLTFRVKLTYDGLGLDPEKTYEVTYEVRGGEDPLVNTLEATGESYTADQEEMISTKSSHAVLKAVVTDVSEQ